MKHTVRAASLVAVAVLVVLSAAGPAVAQYTPSSTTSTTPTTLGPTVLPEQITPTTARPAVVITGQLSRTGSDTVVLLRVAFAGLVVGAGLMVLARRDRRHDLDAHGTAR